MKITNYADFKSIISLAIRAKYYPIVQANNNVLLHTENTKENTLCTCNEIIAPKITSIKFILRTMGC